MTVEIDDSFKKPGAVPFKWEIRPGVPKLQHHSSPLQPKKHLYPPPLVSPSPPSFIATSRSRHPSPFPDLQPRSSFRSAPRAHSERWRSDKQRPQTRRQPEVVAPGGCFINLPALPKLLLLRKKSSKKNRTVTAATATTSSSSRSAVSVPEEEDDYGSDGLETLSRWSVSSRRSLSPLYYMDSPASPYSYSSSSCDQPSPRPPLPPMGDPHWAGFGLF